MDPAADLLRDARRLLVFTGAGVSTESGIPDFRSPGGARRNLATESRKGRSGKASEGATGREAFGGARPEGLAGLWTKFDPSDFSYDRFLEDPSRYWRLRAELMDAMALDTVRPNAAHVAIAEAEKGGRVLGVVTQNIDGLHPKAGTSGHRLAEIHGNAQNVRCIACGKERPYAHVRAAVEGGEVPPKCPDCEGILKPATVLFGEPLPADVLARAEGWAKTCDACLVVGSSLQVWPAAGLPHLAAERGARLVIVNRDPTPLDAAADAVVHGSASERVPTILREAGFLPQP